MNIYLLKKADFNISDIFIEKKNNYLSDAFVEYFVKKDKGIDKDISKDLEFEHTVGYNKYTLPFNDESQGTQRYYEFAGLLSILIKGSAAFSIDELEASLHPDLFIHFLLSFLVNSKKSQIIATTHNREILNNKDIFRNDAIWITDKSENSATELYSLSHFDTSVIRDTSNIYNAYKIGKLGGIPNLGDYYIDIDHETD